MRANSGLMELIFVLFLMVAAIPLYTALVIQMNNDTFYYLDDKTVYELSDNIQIAEYTIECLDNEGNIYYTPVLLPTYPDNVRIDFGAAMALPIVQDDYCPQNTDYKYEFNVNKGRYEISKIFFDNKVTYQYDWPLTHNPDMGLYTMEIQDGWGAVLLDKANQVRNQVGSNQLWKWAMCKINNELRKFYLVWDNSTNSWIITAQHINIYE